MFNKDFLFSAIKRVFAGDPIKFNFIYHTTLLPLKVTIKKIIAFFPFFPLFLFEVYTKLLIFANEFRT